MLDPILDVRALEDLEYFFQMSFFTADLHITRAWNLAENEDKERLSQMSQESNALIVLSFIELNRSIPPISFDSTLTAGGIPSIDSSAITFRLGIHEPPEGFRLRHSLKRSDKSGKSFHKIEGDAMIIGFEKFKIPHPYTSIYYRQKEIESTNFRCDVRLAHPHQALPIALIEIEFKPLRIEVTAPLCEICLSHDAEIFCPADRIHLCKVCDLSQHGIDKLLAAHKRVPVSESPCMFGPCQFHPSENADTVCLSCFIIACPQCLLIGPHCDQTYAEHELVSTVEAYRIAMASVKEKAEIARTEDESNESDDEENESSSDSHTLELENVWKSRLRALTNQLEEVLVNGESIKSRLDSVSQDRRQLLCSATERQLLSTLQQIDWTDEFLIHIRSSLNPTDFLYFKQRHDAMMDFIFRDSFPSNVLETLPNWFFKKIKVEGSLAIGPSVPPPLQMMQLIDKIEPLDKQNVLSKLYFTPNSTHAQENLEKEMDAPQWCEFETEAMGVDPSGAVSAQTPQLYCNLPIDQENNRPTNTVYATPAPPFKPSAATPLKFDPVRHLVESYYKPLEETKQKLETIVTTFNPQSKNGRHIRQNVTAGDPKSVFLSERVPEKFSGGTIEPANSRIPSQMSNILLPRDKYSISESMKELWRLLKEYKWEALIMLLKTCPKSVVRDLIGHVCNFASIMNQLDNVIEIILEIEYCSYSQEAIPFKKSSLIGPLLQHVLGTPHILIKKERSFIQSLIQPSLASLKPESSITEVESVCEALIDRIITLTELPKSLANVIFMTTFFASEIPTVRYPKMLLDEFESDALLRPQPAGTISTPSKIMPPLHISICIAVDTFIRYCIAESVLQFTVMKALENKKDVMNKESRVCVAIGNLLKQIGLAVWKLPADSRFSADRGAGSDDREMFLQVQANRLHKWMAVNILPKRSQGGIETDRSHIPLLRLQVMRELCDYLVGLDGAIWRQDFDIFGGSIAGDLDLRHFIEKIRNYDKLIVIAMTCEERQTHLAI